MNRCLQYIFITMALIACAGWYTAAAAQPSQDSAGGQAPAGISNNTGQAVLLCRLDPNRFRQRAVDQGPGQQYDRQPYQPPLRINRVYVRASHVIVELKRHGSALLTDRDYTTTRVTVSAHPSGVPYYQITLSAMDRLRHLNSDIRVINWITPLVLSGPANVTAVLRFHGHRYTKTQGLVP